MNNAQFQYQPQQQTQMNNMSFMNQLPTAQMNNQLFNQAQPTAQFQNFGELLLPSNSFTAPLVNQLNN